MATRTKTRAHRIATRKLAGGPGASKDALALLKADHREVEGWFDDYQDLTDDARKTALVAKISRALKVHTKIEEEIFYPAARAATKDNALLDEADVEHACAKGLLAQIDATKVGDSHFDARVQVLGEQIKHHAKEEEDELFPEARESKMDLVELGARMAARKAELMRELAR